MEDYIKCQVIDGGSPKRFLTCLRRLYNTHINNTRSYC